MGSINTKRISQKEWNKMPVVEVPANAEYYISEYCRIGNLHMDWVSYYDKDFNFITEGKQKVRISLRDKLTEIVRTENKDMLALTAYNLIDLKNGFLKVEKVEERETTGDELKAISKSLL